MAALRTMEDFINQRLGVDGCKRLHIVRRADGRFEAAVVHSDGKSSSVDVQDSPSDALWNCLVPHTMRRTAPSGRVHAAPDAPIAPPRTAVEAEIEALLSI